MIGHDAHFVEKKAAEDHDRTDQSRIAEKASRQYRQANQRGDQSRQREVEIGERPQRTRIVLGQFLDLMAEDQGRAFVSSLGENVFGLPGA